LIDAIRAEVVKGTYSHEDICFIFEGETILMNEYGRMANWPKGFNDMSMRICYDIIRGARDKRKKVS
jgi:hypothetical protein